MQQLEPIPVKPARILIVEDEAIVARDLQLQIQELGYERVGAVAEGEHAIRRAGELRPDLVLMDVRLAGAMDGITAAQAIREQFALPVVFLTAFTTDATIARAKLTDPFGYIIKPYTERDLRVGIELALYKHQAERKLQASEEYHRTILQAAMDGFCVVDRQGRVLEVNAAYCRMSGYSAPELLTMRISDLEAVQTAAEMVAGLQQVRAQGEGRFEVHHRRKDGSIFDVEISAQYRPIANGQLVVFLRDITARREAAAEQEKLAEQNRQLQKAESLGRMAGAIAHNFNNQLHVVIMNLELALEDLPPHTSCGANLSAAMQSARKAATISSQMLTYLGQSQVRREPLDLSEACRRGLSLLQAALPKAMALETDLPAPGPVISANANQIQQVLTHLLTNAWEASSNGAGALRLTVKLVSATAIPRGNRFPIDWQPRDPAYACLEVADSGCGIAAGDIEKLCEPFFTSKFTGRGLGLPVVLGIVREHGGGITVESEPGRGSVFRVFLPVTVEAVAPKPVPVALAPKLAGHGTILVVEDEPSLCKLVTVALQRIGFTVFAAVDGVEAVELFGQHRDEINCVLCDLTMPRMGGWETLTALRKLAPGLPVILSSGYNDAKVMEGDHPELPQAFLQKPYEFKALINAINQAAAGTGLLDPII